MPAQRRRSLFGYRWWCCSGSSNNQPRPATYMIYMLALPGGTSGCCCCFRKNQNNSAGVRMSPRVQSLSIARPMICISLLSFRSQFSGWRRKVLSLRLPFCRRAAASLVLNCERSEQLLLPLVSSRAAKLANNGLRTQRCAPLACRETQCSPHDKCLRARAFSAAACMCRSLG